MKEWIGITDWEIFRDVAYYDMWAVRPAGERLWGRCFHVPSKEEAEGLRDLLSSPSATHTAIGDSEKIGKAGK